MRYTRTALGLLNNQYRSILKKCLMINLGIFAYIGTANAETEISAEYLNSVTQFNDRVVWEKVDAAGANTVQIGDEYYKYTYTQPSDYTAAQERLTDANITEEAVTKKVFVGFSGSGQGGAIYNSTDHSAFNITSDFFNNKASDSTSSNFYGNAIYNSGKWGNLGGVFIDNSATTSGDIFGGVIRNDGELGNITADFIANKNNQTTGGHFYGGAILNNGTRVGNITASFIGNDMRGYYTTQGAILSNDSSIMGNVEGYFIGNYIEKGEENAGTSLMGALIYNGAESGAAQMGNITGDMLYNNVKVKTANDDTWGGLILNYFGAEMGNIEGNIENNIVDIDETTSVYGGLLMNFYTSEIGNIAGDILSNTINVTQASSDINGGLIFNYYQTEIGDITGDIAQNKIIAGQAAEVDGGLISNAMSNIGTISSDFTQNEIEFNGDGDINGGIILNYYEGIIKAIQGNFIENTVKGTKGDVMGGIINNDTSTITDGIYGSFIDNSVTVADADSKVYGAAIYTKGNLKIGADSSIGDGVTTFQGNYAQVANGEKDYQAIYVDDASRILTLEAKNDGVINMYDYIDGSAGYTTTLTGDANSTINLYNDIKNSNVTTDTVNISTADGTLHDYSMLSLNSDAAVKWKIDIDAKNQTADTIATSGDAASIGTITLNEINYADSTQADIVDGFNVQILKTQGSPEAANLQLALSDDLSDEFVISQTEEVVTDEVTADTKWSDVFNKTTTATTTSGQFALATTDTLNDSISATVTTATEKTVEKLGDTLVLVNKAELDDKSFTADTADEVYTLEDDLGDTYGNLTIRGVAESEQKSTVDLNGHDSFTVPEGASLTLIDVNLKGDAPLSNAGYADFYNAEVEGEVDNSGILTARESKLTTLVNNEEARLIGGSADEVNNYNVFAAEDAELGTFVNDGDAILTNGSANEVISNGVLETLDTEIVTLINNGYAELNGGYVGDTLNEDELTAKDAILGALSNNGEATLISSSADEVTNNDMLTAEDTVIATLTNEGEATLIDSSAGDVTNNNILTAENTYMTTFTNDGEATLIGGTADNIINNGVVDLTDTDFTTIDGYDGVVNMFSDVDLSGKKVSNNMLALQGTKATVAADSFGDGVVLVAESGAEVDIGNNKVSVKQATFDKDSQLTLKIDGLNNYGALTSDGFDIIEGAKLSAILGQNPLDGAMKGEMTLLSLNDGSDINNNNFTDEFNNKMYTFKRKSEKSGVYEVYQAKTAEEISRENGGTKTNQEAAAAWVDGASFAGGAAAVMADGLAELAQTDGAAFNKALTAVAPNDDGMVQAVTADLSDRLLLTVDNHLDDAAQEQGLASGDNGKTRGYLDLSGVSTWAKGYYGESKLQRRADIYGFDADSIGIIAGVDKKITSSIKAGLGMQYDDTDVDAYNRDVEAKTTLGFVYGEYRLSNWFVNGVFGYGVTDYDEDKSAAGQKVAAHYKAEIYSAQGLAGYTFKYFTPEIGARYYKIKRHGYVDGIGQEVSGENMDLLRTMAGVKAHADYGMFKPNAYFGMVYDVVSDRDNAIVNLTNGASYTVHGKRLPRFGVELGVGVSAQVTSKLELAIGYEAKFREDYQDHSGTATLKYCF